MLSNILGIHLVLLVGKTIPLPASYDVMSAFESAQVTLDTKGADGFQMTFSLTKEVLDYNLLTSDTFAPGARIIMGVAIGVIPEVLIDGIITVRELRPSNDPGRSLLTLTGSDLTVALDLGEKNQKYENQPDSVIFERLIGEYATYGLVPEATPTTDIPITVQRTPRQHQTDLKFIQRMAKRNGFIFYLTPLTFGTSTAYFGPETHLGLPQPALSMNMGPSTNIDELNFSHDALAPVGTKGTFVEPITKFAIPIPTLPSLKIPPLSSSPASAMRQVLLRDTAKQNAGQAATTAIAKVTNSPDAVSASGKVDSVRYGNVLRARQLVGVRGVGSSYDGNYFVKRVTHHIARGSYTQSFSLSREGTGALFPVVRP